MIQSVGTNELPDVEALARLISGFRAAGVVCAAARLDLPDLVAEDGTSPAELARQVNCDPDAIRRLMRALASVGVFAEASEGEYVHTDASRLLRRSAQPSLHGLACFTSLVDLMVWPHILSSLRTGQPAFDAVFGTSIFEYMKGDSTVSAAFDAAMAGYTEVVADAVLGAYDFGRYRHIVDIGGGNGSFLKKILARAPGTVGTIYDLDHVVARAMASVHGTSFAGRLNGIAGDFLRSVPSDGELYTIKIVLCDWRDEDVARILANVRRVIGEGRLLIVDGVIPEGNTSCFAKLSDINMLVTTGSRERTEREYRALLAANGFEVLSVGPVHEWVGLIEAIAAPAE
jgi:hypothetical protein